MISVPPEICVLLLVLRIIKSTAMIASGRYTAPLIHCIIVFSCVSVPALISLADAVFVLQ